VESAVTAWLDVAYVPQGLWLGELSPYETALTPHERMLPAQPIFRERDVALAFWLERTGTLDGLLVWERECLAFGRPEIADRSGHLQRSALADTAFGYERGSGRMLLHTHDGSANVLLITPVFQPLTNELVVQETPDLYQ
jgi:hypothetical protein